MGNEDDQSLVAPNVPPLKAIVGVALEPACTMPPEPTYSEPPVRLTTALPATEP